jgi:hypothetical protein
MTYNVINPILCFVFENVILLIRMRQRCPYHMMFVSFENKTTGVTHHERKRTNNDLQHITQKAKNRATRTPQKPGLNSEAPEGLAVPAPHVTPVVLFSNDTNII